MIVVLSTTARRGHEMVMVHVTDWVAACDSEPFLIKRLSAATTTSYHLKKKVHGHQLHYMQLVSGGWSVTVLMESSGSRSCAE